MLSAGLLIPDIMNKHNESITLLLSVINQKQESPQNILVMEIHIHNQNMMEP